jgi:hypothetical protein
LQTIWTVSPDNTTLTFNQVPVTGQLFNLMQATVTFSNNQQVTLTANLTYITAAPVSSVFFGNTFLRNYLRGKVISIDMSSFVSTDKTNYSGITISV